MLILIALLLLCTCNVIESVQSSQPLTCSLWTLIGNNILINCAAPIINDLTWFIQLSTLIFVEITVSLITNQSVIYFTKKQGRNSFMLHTLIYKLSTGFYFFNTPHVSPSPGHLLCALKSPNWIHRVWSYSVWWAGLELALFKHSAHCLGCK